MRQFVIYFRVFVFSSILLVSSNCVPPEEAAVEDETEASDPLTDEEKLAAEKKKQEQVENTDATTLAISSNPLASAYPEGLAVNAFPHAIDTEPGTPAPGTLAVGLVDMQNPPPNGDMQGDDAQQGGGSEGELISKKTNREKLRESIKRLNGESECFDSNVLRNFLWTDHSSEFCYGNGYGIISGTVVGTADTGKVNPALDPLKDSGDSAAAKEALLAIEGFQPNSSGEVCMVGVARSVIAKTTRRLEAGLDLVQGILCQAKKNGLEKPPTESEPVDLTDVVSAALASQGGNVKVSKVTIERLPAKANRLRFKTTVGFEKKDNSDSNPESLSSLTLVHSPGLKGNQNYFGTLYVKGKREEQGKTSTTATSMTYRKSEFENRSRLILDVRGAHFPHSEKFGDSSSPFAAGKVNFQAGESASSLALSKVEFSLEGEGGDPQMGQPMGPALNHTVTNGTYMFFDIDPSSNAGRIEAWNAPGGAPNGFITKTTQDPDTGKLKGCAWAGSDRDSSIGERLAAKEALRPTGCFTSLIKYGDCGKPNDNAGNQIWKQCFKQNDDGVYEVDTDLTVEAAGYSVITANSADAPEVVTEVLESPLD